MDLAASENGKAEALEKSRSSIFTCSSTSGFQWPTVRRRVSRPLVIRTSFTERSNGILADDGAGDDAGVGLAAQSGEIPIAGWRLHQRNLEADRW